MIIFLYTFMPSLIGFALIYFLDRNREPILTIFTILFAGFLLCLPAGLLNNYLPPLIGLSDDDAFIAGFTEEPLKFLAFLMFVKTRKEFYFMLGLGYVDKKARFNLAKPKLDEIRKWND